MDVLTDQLEAYRIMCEVFFQNIPKNQRTKVLADAAELIRYEVKEADNA